MALGKDLNMWEKLWRDSADSIKEIDAPLCGAISSNNFEKLICKLEFQPGMFSNLKKWVAGFKRPKTSARDLLSQIHRMALFLKH